MQGEFQLGAFMPYRINRLAEQMSQSLALVYAERFGISIAQWRILATLDESPGLSAKAVAAHANLDKVRVSRAVADLETRALLRRRANINDGRSSELYLTASGRRLFGRIAPLALQWEGEILGALSAAETRALGRLLDRLESRLQTLGGDHSAAPMTTSR